MEITRIADLRPRFVWDIVDDAFDLYRERFLSFLALTAAAFVPFRLIQIAITETLVKPSSKSEDAFATFMGTVFISLPIGVLIHFLANCAVVVSVKARLEGQEPDTVVGTYRRVFKRAGTVIGALFYVVLWETFGLFTGGLLTLYFVVATIFVAPVILVEKRPLRAALKRSYQLSTADQGPVLGVLFLTWLLISLLVGGSAALFGGLIALLPHSSDNPFASASLQRVTSEIITSIAEMLLAPIGAIAATLLYFDLRVRREGIDLVAAAQETGVTLAPDPFGDLPSDSVLKKQLKERRKRR